MSRPRSLITPVSQQLQFPWPEVGPLPRTPLPDAPRLPPAQLWTSLSPLTRAHVRSTLLRIIQEVLNDATRP
jgi:hypothetical protein